MTAYCRKHKMFENIIGYSKDDPILACGLVKRRTVHDDRIAKCQVDVDRFVVSQSVFMGISIEDARENLISDLLKISYAN
jgi:hypothetical protein